MTEAMQALGPRGGEFVQASGVIVAPERYPPVNRPHFLGINDIRIAVLQSAQVEGMELGFFYASWELQQRGWRHSLVPDALLNLEGAGRAVTAAFEYDQGTETIPYLVRVKCGRYARGLDGFPLTHVLVVME